MSCPRRLYPCFDLCQRRPVCGQYRRTAWLGPKSFGSWLHCLHLSSYVSFVLLPLEGKDARTRYSNAIGQLAGNIFNILQHYYRLYRQLLNETFVVLTWISSTWRNKSVVSNGFSHRFILRLHHCFYQQPVS